VPVLLRYSRLTEEQKATPAVDHAWRNLVPNRSGQYMSPEYDWRRCFWFVNSRQRLADNRNPVLLTELTPLEVLLTCEPLEAADARARPVGVSLLAEARRRLCEDVLDSKLPLLVLSDWLEENGLPEHSLLRPFCGMKQRWDRLCLPGSPGHSTLTALGYRGRP
jgi:hypothetical protein